MRNKLPDNINKFFDDLTKYIDTKLYFFGSVQRNDYIHGSSDIDIDIFTDNIDSIINKIQHFLHVKKKKIKKIIWKNEKNNLFFNGYKIYYTNTELNFSVDFCIYDNKFKNDILNKHLNQIDIPYYISFILYIIKIIHYKLNIINYYTYKYLKNKIFSICLGMPNIDFLTLN